jgi:hypothetical protein
MQEILGNQGCILRFERSYISKAIFPKDLFDINHKVGGPILRV